MSSREQLPAFAFLGLGPWAVALTGLDAALVLLALPLCWIGLRGSVRRVVIGAALLAISTLGASFTVPGMPLNQFAVLPVVTLIGLLIAYVAADRAAAEWSARHAALHDAGSGLPNEAHLIALTDNALTSSTASIVVLRLTGLRAATSSLRPELADQLIATIVDQLDEIVASHRGLAARLSYDRFAVLAAGLTEDRTRVLAERVVAGFSRAIEFEASEFMIDPRAGIAVSSLGDSGETLLAHADHAAELAADGARIKVYDAASELERRARDEMIEDLRTAVRTNDFRLAFQPIVNAKDGRVVAAEALLRWVNRKRGAVSPVDFIPLAEESGLILSIGRWVLDEACRCAADWPHVGGEPIAVSVNVSPIQIADDGFLHDVAGALERHGLPASRLKIEITEGLILDDIDRTVQCIAQLREMGVETMLDDFGTGHSSLAWVQKLPVGCIKVDRAFVADIDKDGINRAIVHASLYLSRALGTITLVEGVETEAQREQLVRMGCQHLQGFLFARPQPAEVFPDWLARQRKVAAPDVQPSSDLRAIPGTTDERASA